MGKKFRSNRATAAITLALDGINSFLPASKKPHILIACMPKSASTYLATVMSELPGFRRCRLTPAWGSREQELSQIRLSRYNHCRYVAQHHLKYSDWTQNLITQYNITPIVTVRNFADCVLSIRDYFRQIPEAGPVAYFDDQHLEMSDSEFEVAIVNLAIPWYLNFHCGWVNYAKAPIFDYDDLVENTNELITKITEEAGLKVSNQEIQAAVKTSDTKQTRQNVGKIGRGENISPDAAEALLRLLNSYPRMREDPLFAKSIKSAETALMKK